MLQKLKGTHALAAPRISRSPTAKPTDGSKGTGANATTSSAVGADEDDGRKASSDSQFAEHMKKAAASKNKGGSHFARTKSLKEQRQYLPAFASREALLKIVRENQGAPVVRFR